MNTPDSPRQDNLPGTALDTPANAAPTASELAPQSEPKHPHPPSTRHRHAVNRWHIEPVLEVQEESWLMTYLDVITLLLVMMVVMLSLAGPPNGQASASAENTPPDPVTAAPAPTQVTPDIVPPVPLPVAVTATQDLLAGLPLEQLGKDVQVIAGVAGVSFRINSELLFESGAAVLASPGAAVLTSLIPVLNAKPTMQLVVQGHTDDVPIQTERFPSNWELSTGRAASVARHLISQGIDPARVRATGFADTRPLAPNGSAQQRAGNRRVDLVLEEDPAQSARPSPATR